MKAPSTDSAKEADKAPSPEEAAEKAAEKELKRMRLEADLREQRLSAELASLKAEKAKLEAALALAREVEARLTGAALGYSPLRAPIHAACLRFQGAL